MTTARIVRATRNPLDPITPDSILSVVTLLDPPLEEKTVPDVPRATAAVIRAGRDPTLCACVYKYGVGVECIHLYNCLIHTESI